MITSALLPHILATEMNVSTEQEGIERMFHTAWRFPLGHRVECIRDGRLVEDGVGVALGLIECISAWFSVQLNIKRHGCLGFFSRL